MEKVSNYDLIDSSVAERILLKLFRHALSCDKEKAKSALETTISIEGYYSVPQDYDEDFDLTEVTEETIGQLKSAGIIKSYSDFIRGDQDPEDYETAYTICTYYPYKVATQLEKIWEPKREAIQKLIPVYQKFTTLVLEYLKSSKPFDESSNEYYLQLKDEIISLTKHLDSDFIFARYIPFESLYSARKELDGKKTTLRKVSNKMLDFYGKLIDKEKSIDLEKYEKRELDLQSIDSHISDLKIRNAGNAVSKRNYKKILINKPMAGELKVDFQFDKLVFYNDGTLWFENEPLDMGYQLKALCRMFMESPKQLIPIEDIKENIIPSSRRKNIKNTSIAKYVSELHRILQIHFKRSVIFNEKRVGWSLKI